MNRDLRIGRNGKGRAVFAMRTFSRGEIIESCPMLILPEKDAGGVLEDYRWWWGEPGKYALALGISSLFNHSTQPNVGFRRLFEKERMVFRALVEINMGHELVINYGEVDFDVLPPDSSYKQDPRAARR